MLTAAEIVTGRKMPRFKYRGIDEATGEIVQEPLEQIAFEAKCGTRFVMLWPVGMPRPPDGQLEVVEYRGSFWLPSDLAHARQYAGTDMMISCAGRAGHIVDIVRNWP